MLWINKWNDVFESANSRKLKKLQWCHLPSGLDSNGYIELVSHGQEGIVAFGVFIALCQWASTNERHLRGICCRSDGRPYSVNQLATILRIDREIVGRSVELLCSEDIRWMSQDESVQNADSITTKGSLPASLPWRAGESPTNLPPENAVKTLANTSCGTADEEQSPIDLPPVSHQSPTGLPPASQNLPTEGGEEKEEREERESTLSRGGVVIPESMRRGPVIAAMESWVEYTNDPTFSGKPVYPGSPQEERLWAMVARWRLADSILEQHIEATMAGGYGLRRPSERDMQNYTTEQAAIDPVDQIYAMAEEAMKDGGKVVTSFQQVQS